MHERRSLRKLNVSELAEVSGLSPATVSSRLNAAGIAPAEIVGTRKLFDAPQALRNLLGAREHDPAGERASLDATKREMLELQIGEKRGELVSADELDRAVIELSTATSARIQSIPDALALEVATETDPSKCKAVLKGALDDALEDLARAGREAVSRAARAPRARAGTRGNGAAAKPERARVGNGAAHRAARDDAGAGTLEE